jgi:diaminopimelate epimerase
MNLSFAKYHGTGNDFILIDNRAGQIKLSASEIARLCHRRFGIGSDGLLLLNSHPTLDFQMINYNSDGRECSMCGNGARTLVQFAADLGLKKDHYRFLAVDGEHEATLKKNQIELKMQNVQGLKETPLGVAVETGSPHLVVTTKNIENLNLLEAGRALRYAEAFAPAGINANFTEWKDDTLWIRTYERGVEDETLSCGTGAIAAAIVASLDKTPIGNSREVKLRTQGGRLTVCFRRTGKEQFEDIWLIGEATRVYQGKI